MAPPFETLDDGALAQQARSGDRQALEDLLRSHSKKIHAVCSRMCGSRGEADDAAQEALISIVRGIGSFDGRAAVSSWIYRITVNACLDELRRRRRRPEPVDLDELPTERVPTSGQPSPSDMALHSETRRELRAALALLPEEFRVAVVLRDVADLDYSTIADITEVPVGTVRSRIARGRGRLADVFDSGTNSGPATSNRPETS